MEERRPSKRARLELSDDTSTIDVRAKHSAFLSSLSRPVSPPNTSTDAVRSTSKQNLTKSSGRDASTGLRAEPRDQTIGSGSQDDYSHTLSSPFQLTRVRGLPPHLNRDTTSLHDILGDPLIKEAWIFNFCFDVNWTMQHFDADVRALVQVKIVHGSWKQEDSNRQGIEEDMKNWKNVEDTRAYLPDPFGTHHSKMIILFKHDETARVIIHTANMLEKDWDHMTQAVWQSPILPLLNAPVLAADDKDPVGSGTRFKTDLLRYLKAYGNKLKLLSDQLAKHDFSQIRAALIASVPSDSKVSDPPDKIWGHLSLRKALQSLTSTHKTLHPPLPNTSHLISQISSIATLPQTYLQETLYKATTPSTTSIIYPTPSDLRSALTGYATGGSIHTKTSTPAHHKQVEQLRSQFHRWGTQSPNAQTRAGRHMIPPHIKTYITFTSKPTLENLTPDISWALLTSANLSQQAWGTTPKLPRNSTNPGDAVSHIQSYEIGVLVWPELLLKEPERDPEGLDEKEVGTRNVRMVPVFGRDTPEAVTGKSLDAAGKREVLVGLRMPYDLPLTPYAAGEMPWSPNQSYSEPDSSGRTWPP